MRKDESRWHNGLVEAVKKDVKSTLNRNFSPDNARARLRFIQAEIARLEGDHSPLGQLQRFVYIVTAIVHHHRFGGLKSTQVSQLETLGEAVLMAQGIKPRSSRLSYLYGDLHLILSQIHRKEGRQWQAAWEQSYGDWLSRGRTNAELGFETLGMANRALRHGHLRLATTSFEEAERLGLEPVNFAKARLGRIKSLRLSGMLERALALAVLSRPLLSGDAAIELRWEELCINVQQTGDLGKLRAAVSRGKPHCQATYIIEAYHWLMGSSRNEAWEGMPTIRYLARDPQIQPQQLGMFFKIALQIERSYMTESPLPVRMRQLGELLAETARVASIDKEMLAWVASARWLARCKSYALASLALNEYEALCLRVSSGESHDVFGIATDLMARPWYTGTAPMSREKVDEADATAADAPAAMIVVPQGMYA